ncbi:MAG TPA: hypothetical protein ENJ65_02240 [Candidatus Tenderia electrophaga]|uniref:Yip1 domain-containing protein n=1 Tax=Candidatus Tenderia electrophaga TaxID=1748243 RepID=A0A832J341_9GAMM|nr:hypothetical protein [Candidatus Tenderia electrophaga]
MGMKKVIEVFWQICLLKRAPQELPASSFLLLVSVLAYGMAGFLMGVMNMPAGQAFISSVLDIALVGSMTQLLLWIKDMGPRFQQAFTALMGSGAILGFLALPVLFLQMQMGDQPAFIPSLMIISMVIWNLTVVGHILRHTISAPFFVGMLLAVTYMYVSMSIMRSLFATTS